MSTIDFQYLFESVLGLHLVLSPDLKVIAASDMYLDAIGKTREELSDCHFFEIFPDSHHPSLSDLRSSLDHVLRLKTVHTIEAQTYDLPGLPNVFREKFWKVQNKPMLDAHQKVLYIIHSLEDTTALKRAETTLHTSQTLFRSNMESLKDVAILSIDRNYHITDFNTTLRENMLRTYGKDIEPGINLLECITNDDDRKKVKDSYDRAFTGESYIITEEFGDVEFSCYETRFNPIFDNRQEIIGVISFSVNITERKKAEKQLQENQLLLQSTIESNKDVLIFSIDTNYRYLNFNTTFRVGTIAAYGTDVRTGMSLFDSITSEDDRERVKNNCDRALAGESHITVEGYGELEREYYETRYNPIVNGNNEILGVTVLSTNITKRKRAEEQIHKLNEELSYRATELERSNKLFSNLFYHNPASIAISRLSDAKIMDVNESFLSLFGFSAREEVIGRTAEELNIFVDSDQRAKLLELLQKHNRVFNIEGRFRTTKGDFKWASTSAHVVEIGDTPCLLAVTLDITQRKKQEELLNIQAENLRQANAELETFSYSVSHDLKAPLRSLEGFSKALLDTYKGKLDADADRWLNFIADNAHRMGVLINDILSFSRVSRSNVSKTHIDMKLLAERAFTTQRVNYPDKTIIFNLETIPDSFGDNAMLGQVWQNLISNALKYSSNNKTIHITITGRTDDDFHIYSIKDNGIGFDEKYKDKLFGVFQRLHTTSEFEGTGVGLAIVNRIIQKHNGWITAHSEKGTGTEFIFAIPTIKD